MSNCILLFRFPPPLFLLFAVSPSTSSTHLPRMSDTSMNCNLFWTSLAGPELTGSIPDSLHPKNPVLPSSVLESRAIIPIMVAGSGFLNIGTDHAGVGPALSSLHSKDPLHDIYFAEDSRDQPTDPLLQECCKFGGSANIQPKHPIFTIYWCLTKTLVNAASTGFKSPNLRII
ncbi:hypothetical protein B0H13DRAFT_1883765 [Mycena leptocephala]|nr:hypothetical protein B0H13DRAFT_1883765 [Mycena leptocephala]